MNWKHLLISFVTLSCIVILQVSVVPLLAINRVFPDLMYLAAVSSSLAKNGVWGAQVGFIAGFLSDVISGRYIGIRGVCYALGAYLAGIMTAKVYRFHFLSVIATTFLTYILVETVYLSLTAMFGFTVHPGAVLFSVIIPAAAYNGILQPVVYALHRRLRAEGDFMEFDEGQETV
ncbi:MAG: rod shape-determining protein MreD [Bacillota bacterium]